MRLTIAVFTTLAALVAAVPAPAPIPQGPATNDTSDPRAIFITEKCQAQPCIDAVNSGCKLQNINFKLGCDLDGPGQ